MEPTLGRIVIYRSRAGVDMPAIVTGLVEGDPDAVFLEIFPPPGASKDIIDGHWGVVQALYPDRAGPCTWRWPERVEAST